MPRQSSGNGHAEQANIHLGNGNGDLSNSSGTILLEDPRHPTVDGSFNDMFDYASFMWDSELQSGNMQSTRWRELGFADMDVIPQRDEMVSEQPLDGKYYPSTFTNIAQGRVTLHKFLVSFKWSEPSYSRFKSVFGQHRLQWIPENRI